MREECINQKKLSTTQFANKVILNPCASNTYFKQNVKMFAIKKIFCSKAVYHS